MTDQNQSTDEFGEDRLLSRLNRRLSYLMQSLPVLPNDWEDEPTVQFKRHLARVNSLALTVLMLGSVAAGILVMILAIKTDTSWMFFTGVGIIPGVFLFQYILSLFCSANLNLSFGSPIRLVTRLVPEVLTVAGILGIVYVVVMGVIATSNGFEKSLQIGLTLTVFFTTSAFVAGVNAWVAANSEKLLGLAVEPNDGQGPADYIFSLVLYLGRYWLVLVPYQFLATMLLGAFLVIYVGISQLVGKSSGLEFLDFALVMGGLGIAQAGWIVSLPILSHFAYLLFVSLADIGVAFFRLVKGTEKIARLSEEAMSGTHDAAGDQ